MAYVNVPKDLTKIKSKVLFNLTKRQLICFGLAALMGVPLFFLLKGGIGTTAAAMVMIVVMLPGFLFGVYEKNGQPLEVVGRQIIESCFLRPKERPYQTVNAYDALVCQYQMEQEVKAIVEKSRQRGSKKHGGQAQAHPRRNRLKPSFVNIAVTASPIPRRTRYPIRSCTRTASAISETGAIRRALSFLTSTICSRSLTIRRLFLNISAICITIWILPSMCSSPIPTASPIGSSLLGALKCRPAMTV